MPESGGSDGFESERWFRELLERGLLLVVGLDERGHIRYLNRRLRDLAGRSAEGGIGADWFDEHILDEEMDQVRSVFESVLSGATEQAYFENRIRIPGRRPRLIGWFNIRVHDGESGLLGTLSAGEDVTERRRLERRLKAEAELARTILEEDHVSHVLEVIANGACEMLQAKQAMVLAPSRDSAGIEVRVASNENAGDLAGAALPQVEREGLTTGVLAEVSTASDDTALRGLLAWPDGPMITAAIEGRQQHGLLIVFDDPALGHFEEEHRTALEGFAREAALAIEHGEANRRLGRLAVIEDRERIARDLHDVVIQDLFAAGMSVDVAMQMLEDQEDVEERLEGVVELLNRAIQDLRGSIFSLRDDSKEDLRSRVLRLIAESTAALGLTASVRVENATHPLPEEVSANLLATLREALSNVARHSDADEVTIHVTAGPALTLVVHDNGNGLKETANAGQGFGNMRSRANDLGGEFRVGEPGDGGVRLEWTVPLEVS